MPPKNLRPARGRGKRPRASSREEAATQGFAPADHLASQPEASQLESSFKRPESPSSSASKSLKSSATPEVRSTHPINAITTDPPPGKVAIPALRPPQSLGSGKGSKKGRTSHACDYCRKSKAGCSGGQPCARCRDAQVNCVYGDGKREHDRKMMKKLNKESVAFSQHSLGVTEALRRIQLDTSLSHQELRAAIDGVLAMSLLPASPGSEGGLAELSGRPSSERGEPEPSEEREAGGAHEDSEVGSTGSMDVIDVDTDLDATRGTGLMGKASAVSWAKRTSEECQPYSEQDAAAGKIDTSFAHSSYHVTDADVEYVDTSNVNPYDWPEHKLADTLVRLYFDHVHNAFPALDRAGFMRRYNSFVRGSNELDPSDVIFFGTLNMVFAISSLFANLSNYQDQEHVDDHLIYSARAEMLCMGQTFILQDARISTTCFSALLALYYVSKCELNRAWTVCALGIRNALTLGLHVRSEVKSLSDVDKEHRVRLWWALYSLEVLLNELTGRPSCISDRDISTPLPININENDFIQHRPLYEREDSGHSSSSGRRSSKGRPSATYQMPVGYSHPIAFSFPVVELPVTSSTFFIYRTQLAIISHEIITQLYCAATIKEKWSEVQDTMRSIDRRLLSWRDALPKEFDITFDTWAEPDWEDPHTLPRIGLAMFFNSSRMILFRPCLCRFKGRMDNQSQSAKDFEQEAVENCIHSARKIISLLKWNAKSEDRFYSISPWWHSLHYVCEALSVLMLAMAFEAQHLPNESADILADAKKGIYWLAMLSVGSIAARKAWEIFDSLIRLVAPRIKWSVFDLPTTAPIPARYNWRRFGKPNTRTPWNQFSQENSQAYQASQPNFQDSNPTWANQDLSQFPANFPEYFGNQLDRNTAIERFANMGHLHWHYDDPWEQLFAPTTVDTSIGMTAPTATSQSFVQGSGVSNEEYLTRGSFNGNVGGHETLSSMNVQGFSSNDPFEAPDEQERLRQKSRYGFVRFQGSGF